MEWISVKDRLPEENGEYLVFYTLPDTEEWNGHKKECYYIADFDKNPAKSNAKSWFPELEILTEYHNWGGIRIDLQAYVTHWQPLPPSPDNPHEK